LPPFFQHQNPDYPRYCLAMLLLSDFFPPPMKLSAAAAYHTRTPRHQWAAQFLGLNITRAYARHLYTCRNRFSSPLLYLLPATMVYFLMS
jgi:hypothetical protein